MAAPASALRGWSCPAFLRLKVHGWRLVRRVALGMCVIYPATLSAQSRSGQFAATGQRTLWLECRGTGSPTVVFEAGHGEDADTWDVVFGRVALLTQACRYDRAGRGRSAPATGVRSGQDVVADLHAALRSAEVRGPLVLVGHSLGGAFVRLYAGTHSRDVVGLVLVDAVHEDEFARVERLLTPAQRAAGAGMSPMSPEGIDINGVFEQTKALPRSSSLRVRVLARGVPLADDEMPPDWNSEQRSARERVRRELQADLATRAGDGTLEWATKSGHFVHHDEPALVVAAIRALVLSAR